jgi:hypothetical protein
MGIAWLLLMRTFATRPKRTVLFLFGYGLATGVMIVLLAVGEAVLVQARDKNLVGGGDLILVPQGIDVESMKVGGISAMYYSIPQARFIVRQMLTSSRFKNEVESISPYLYSEMLYARKPAGTQVEAVLAEGSIPQSEQKMKGWKLPWKNNEADRSWAQQNPEELLQEIDRFHLPSSKELPMDQWSEWHYFNFESDKFYGYLGIIAAGDVVNDRGTWIVSLQMFDGEYKRYATTYPATKDQLPLQKVDYVVGANRVRLADGNYEIDLNFETKEGNVHGRLKYIPVPNLYLPPVILAESEGFESGYVIPSIKGSYEGSISIDSRTYDFTGVSGYHDHNWGIWQQPETSGEPVRWNWGHAFSDTHSLIFGEIFVKNRTRGLFAGVFDKNGFVAMFQPSTIHFSETITKDGLVVPQHLRFSQKKLFTALELEGKAKSFTSSPAGENGSQFFIQYKMDYKVKLKVDDKVHEFAAEGNAETFVQKK